METVCEFCTSLRPVVYCKADAAYLCLSCDAKVHLANPLSSRHIRTLLCDLCRSRPAYVQCLDHQTFICRGCEKLHDVSLQHHKRSIKSYIGCPSATDFAALWGFQLKDVENHQDQHTSSISCSFEESKMANSNIEGQLRKQSSGPFKVSRSRFERTSSNNQMQMLHSGKDHSSILQQIMDLKRLQLDEDNNLSRRSHEKEQADTSSMHQPRFDVEENLDQQEDHSQHCGSGILQEDSMSAELKVEPLPSFANLSSSSIASFPSQGEFFWSCKSPTDDSQFWSQNMQDLGVCEEFVSQDDFNIPDVDLSFRNFEESFGGDQDTAEKHASSTFNDKDKSFGKAEDGDARNKEDSTATKHVQFADLGLQKKGMDLCEQLDNQCRNLDSSFPFQPSSSDSSFCLSRYSAESRTGCVESEISSYISGWGSHFGVTIAETRGNVVINEEDEKEPQAHKKQLRQASQKARAGSRKKVKAHSAEMEE